MRGTYHPVWAAGTGDRTLWPGSEPTWPPLRWSPPAPSSQLCPSAHTSPAEQQQQHQLHLRCRPTGYSQDTPTHLHQLRPGTDANRVGGAACSHLMHKHPRLVAPHHCQLAEQGVPLEGDAEDPAVHSNGFGTRTHQEGRGQGPGGADEGTQIILQVLHHVLWLWPQGALFSFYNRTWPNMATKKNILSCDQRLKINTLKNDK